MNKFEYVWVDPCAVRSNLMRFEHVGGGGPWAPVWWEPPCEQTDRQTHMTENIAFATPLAGSNK